MRETVKTDAGGGSSAGEEIKMMRGFSGGDTSSFAASSSWVPHEGTGIYYPKGQEKVMQDVPLPPRGNHVDELVNWFS
ncbi:unnamed protein product [Cochlearia groenlandica]